MVWCIFQPGLAEAKRESPHVDRLGDLCLHFNASEKFRNKKTVQLDLPVNWSKYLKLNPRGASCW
jgi:hypothetical protein